MKPLRVPLKLESEKQTVDQGHVQGLFAFQLFLPPETFEELLLSATESWETNGCDPRFIQIGMAAARAAYRGETSWTAQASSLSLDDAAEDRSDESNLLAGGCGSAP